MEDEEETSSVDKVPDVPMEEHPLPTKVNGVKHDS